MSVLPGHIPIPAGGFTPDGNIIPGYIPVTRPRGGPGVIDLSLRNTGGNTLRGIAPLLPNHLGPIASATAHVIADNMKSGMTISGLLDVFHESSFTVPIPGEAELHNHPFIMGRPLAGPFVDVLHKKTEYTDLPPNVRGHWNSELRTANGRDFVYDVIGPDVADEVKQVQFSHPHTSILKNR